MKMWFRIVGRILRCTPVVLRSLLSTSDRDASTTYFVGIFSSEIYVRLRGYSGPTCLDGANREIVRDGQTQ